MQYTYFDIIVIGGGHAGTEAAYICSKRKNNTLLITNSIDSIGNLSCNPSMGGIGKGQLLREISTLGGIIEKITEKTSIQKKKINYSKGEAVQSTRYQIDRFLYKKEVINILLKNNKLSILQQNVETIIVHNKEIKGVVTDLGLKFYSEIIILTTGTFLNGKINIGKKLINGGRLAEKSSIKLAENLKNFPFKIKRLKTGTPPKIDKRSIDFTQLIEQKNNFLIYSNWSKKRYLTHPCYITYTNRFTHTIILNNLINSPIYNNYTNIIGPRYCPSIEDKIIKFSKKKKHSIFIEPEGENNIELYINGLSTSLPYKIQKKFVHSIQGLREAKLLKPGYSVEYDFFDPRGIKKTLETKYIKNLFFSGQINGTTGYEEAAAQGLIAGINSDLNIKKEKSFYLESNEAYIGLLINDLTTKGVVEPYRVFTAKIENNIIVREDNADSRILKKSINLSLMSIGEKKRFLKKKKTIQRELFFLRNNIENKNLESIQYLKKYTKKRLVNFLSLNNKDEKLIDFLYKLFLKNNLLYLKDLKLKQLLNNEIKYYNYALEKNIINGGENNIKIPLNINYTKIKGIPYNTQQKLYDIKPETLIDIKKTIGLTSFLIIPIKLYIKKIYCNS